MIFLLLGLFLAAMNLLTFAAFRADKHRARAGLWRVPETTLLTLSFLGGWPAAKVAQHRLRHKTRKEPFRTILNLTLAGPVLMVAVAGAASLDLRTQGFVDDLAQVGLRGFAKFAHALTGGPSGDTTADEGQRTVTIRRGSEISTVTFGD